MKICVRKIRSKGKFFLSGTEREVIKVMGVFTRRRWIFPFGLAAFPNGFSGEEREQLEGKKTTLEPISEQL